MEFQEKIFIREIQSLCNFKIVKEMRLELIFASIFCQMSCIQGMDKPSPAHLFGNAGAIIPEKNKLKISAVTWNLAQSTPFISDCTFLRQFHDNDMVVVGVQECEDIRPRTTEGRRSVAWAILQRHVMGIFYFFTVIFFTVILR